MSRAPASVLAAAAALAVLVAVGAALALTAAAQPPGAAGGPPAAEPKAPFPRDVFPGEQKHLRNLKQLTFAGENAEAYWSFAGDRLVFQSTRPPFTADQIFVMGTDGADVRLVSTGKGRTTCAYFLPGDRRVIFASTHQDADDPPPQPDKSQGYVWGLFSYDLFTVGVDGSDLQRLTAGPGYDAEATVSPKGDKIVFTSSRDGDLDIYTMNLDGTDVRRLTDEVGYDGGPFFSPDGTKIVYRASHPQDEEGKAKFKALLGKGLVRPSRLDIWVMDADGRNKRQVTRFDKASFAPYFTPDSKRIIFSSNLDDDTHRSFELYLVGVDGSGLERVTFFSNERKDDFDGFPMFSPDGKKLVFCSNRHNARPHETNVFVADWVD